MIQRIIYVCIDDPFVVILQCIIDFYFTTYSTTYMRKELCRSLVLISIVACSSFFARSQNKDESNRLLKEVRSNKKDTTMVSNLNELAWLYRKEQSDSALCFATQARLIAEKIQFKSGLATSLCRISEIERIQGNYSMAIESAQKALKIEKEIQDTFGIARAYGQLSMLYSSVGRVDEALEAGELCIDLYKQIGSLSTLANAYDRQSILLQNKGRFAEALSLINYGLEIREQLNDTINTLFSYMSLAKLYSKLSNHSKSVELYNLAIERAVILNDEYNLSQIYTNISIPYFALKEYATAIDYNIKSIKIKTQLKLEKTLDTNFNNLGNCYNKLGEYNKAIEYYRRSIELKEENGKKEGLAIAYNNLGNLYFSQKQYEKALDCYERGLDYAVITDDKLVKLELYFNIYKSYTVSGQLGNAISYSDKYILLRDSLDAAYRNAVNLRDEYLEAKSKNELLEKENQIKDIKIKRRNLQIFSLVGGMALLFLLFFAFFRSLRLKQRTLLAEKNNQINEQKISELLKNQELKSMSAMLEGQEGERKRIAQDLHDRLGSMLSMVKLHFKSVEDNIQSIRENNIAMYNKANNLLDEACDEVRKIAHDLTSGVLNKFGLVPALNNLKESIEATGRLNIEILNFGFDENRLEYNIEINIYRILQELISNILKHSKASDVNIQLLKKEARLNIVVEDNGIGFDVDRAKMQRGLGLKNIESRVDSLNGELNIDSGKGVGTTVTIEIPLNQVK